MKNELDYGLHLRLSLIVPPSIPRPLPAQLEATVKLPPTATAAEIDQAIGSVSRLLDSYAQAITAKREDEAA